jgi:hypothetical protein
MLPRGPQSCTCQSTVIDDNPRFAREKALHMSARTTGRPSCGQWLLTQDHEESDRNLHARLSAS